MTPSPERNEASGMLNKKSNNLNSVERTAEKYSGFYNMGKNVRTTKNANTNNRNDEEEDANENDNENDTDDEFEIGVLNLSNHDINDDDEVLQGVSYLTPPSRSRTHTKYTPKNSTKNTLNGAKNGTKNSTKIPNKPLTPKGSGFAENKSTVNVQYKQNYLSMKTVKTPVKRFLIEKREGSDRKEKLNEKLFDGKYDGKSDGKNGVTCVFMDGVRSDEMAEMTAQIKALTSELKYFEELTGRRCIYETKVRCTHTCTQTHRHIYTHTNTQVHIYINEHTRRYIHIHTYIFTYTLTNVYVHIIVHTHMYMYTQVHLILNKTHLIVIVAVTVTIQIHLSSQTDI